MGKNGKLLREQKKKTVTYTFTAEQLEEHDRLVLQEREAILVSRVQPNVDKVWKEREENAKKVIQDEWAARAREFQQNEPDENLFNLLQYLLSVASRVLIERFGWKPIPKTGHYDRRNRTMRFAGAMIEEIGKIASDENMDIRRYSEETYRLYGVKYAAKGESYGGDH